MKSIRCCTVPLVALLTWAATLFTSVRADETNTASPAPGAEIHILSAVDVLKTLRRQHPRILLTPDSLADLKARLGTDAQLKAWYPAIRDQGQKLLATPILEQSTDIYTARQLQERMRILGFLYMIEGDHAYADRAWKDLDAAAHWPDWTPKNTLFMGEMTCGFAIAYDWLYNAWTPEQRTELRTAIIEMSLKPAIAAPWWTHVNYNWNQVCSGGVGMGALAIADEAPDVATQALQISLTALPAAMASYAPDGGWKEGPTYWAYATTFGIYFIASLESAAGTDANFCQFPGFSRTGLFGPAMTGPTNLSFNFSDSEPIPADGPMLFWLARKFNIPFCVDFQRRHAKPTVMDLIWYPSGMAAGEAPSTNLYFSGADVACFRGSWTDRLTSYVGFKGGDNKFNHSHLDLGSFVFDADGCRFAQMLGSESYGKPGYFDVAKGRWVYYRARAEGANTLVINPGPEPDQDLQAAAPIIKTKLDGDSPFAVADLTAGYAKDASKVLRGISLIRGRQLLVQDEIQTTHPSDVWWHMHTAAKVEHSAASADGRTLVLSGIDPNQIPRVKLQAQILSPPDAHFDVIPAAPLAGTNPPSNQSGNAQFKVLAIHLSNVGSTTIVVTLTPLIPETASFSTPAVTPLDRW